MPLTIKVKIDKNGIIPKKAHSTDAGFDLFAPDSFTVPPTIVNRTGSATINTKVRMQIPEGYCGLIVSKSGLNVKEGITSTGLIDASYTGDIRVKLYNHGESEYRISKGDKISQIMILPVPEVDLVEVDELDMTERGEGGFGSTGR